VEKGAVAGEACEEGTGKDEMEGYNDSKPLFMTPCPVKYMIQ
jgi:hypothetical protein